MENGDFYATQQFFNEMKSLREELRMCFGPMVDVG